MLLHRGLSPMPLAYQTSLPFPHRADAKLKSRTTPKQLSSRVIFMNWLRQFICLIEQKEITLSACWRRRKTWVQMSPLRPTNPIKAASTSVFSTRGFWFVVGSILSVKSRGQVQACGRLSLIVISSVYYSGYMRLTCILTGVSHRRADSIQRSHSATLTSLYSTAGWVLQRRWWQPKQA